MAIDPHETNILRVRVGDLKEIDISLGVTEDIDRSEAHYSGPFFKVVCDFIKYVIVLGVDSDRANLTLPVLRLRVRQRPEGHIHSFGGFGVDHFGKIHRGRQFDHWRFLLEIGRCDRVSVGGCHVQQKEREWRDDFWDLLLLGFHGLRCGRFSL